MYRHLKYMKYIDISLKATDMCIAGEYAHINNQQLVQPQITAQYD